MSTQLPVELVYMCRMIISTHHDSHCYIPSERKKIEHDKNYPYISNQLGKLKVEKNHVLFNVFMHSARIRKV